MTIEDYFNEFPLKEPLELTFNDLKEVLDFCASSVKIIDKDDKSVSREEKIDAYKAFCRNHFEKIFIDLNQRGKDEVNKYLNLYGTHLILQHLAL